MAINVAIILKKFITFEGNYDSSAIYEKHYHTYYDEPLKIK